MRKAVGEQTVDIMYIARGEQQRRRFAEDTSHGEDAAGYNAVHAAGKNNGAYDAPLSGSESEGALAQALRNGLEALLRRAHDGRQVHDDKRHRARAKRGLIAEKFAEKQHADKAVYNARYARERLGGVLDSGDDAVIFRILREVNGRSHAERQHPHERTEDDVQSVEYIRQYADRTGKVARLGGEKLPRYIRYALYEDIGY